MCLQCFVEMESAEDAERMGEHCKEKALKYNGKRLTVYVSRKYRQLKHGSASSSMVTSSLNMSPGSKLKSQTVFVQTSMPHRRQEGQQKHLP